MKLLTWLPDSEVNADACQDFHGLLLELYTMCGQLYTRSRLTSPFRYKTWARVRVCSCSFVESMRIRADCSSRSGFARAACLRASRLTALASIGQCVRARLACVECLPRLFPMRK